jgi:hypothetical protein
MNMNLEMKHILLIVLTINQSTPSCTVQPPSQPTVESNDTTTNSLQDSGAQSQLDLNSDLNYDVDAVDGYYL